MRAGDLAESLRPRDALDFKRDVRKLKELGLTESASSPGYRPLAARSAHAQLAAERALEHVALTLGRPAGDRDVLVGVQAQLDAPVVARATSQRVHGLVARALELLGEPDRGRDPVEQRRVALARERRELAERRACPCGGSARPGRSAPTSRGEKPGRPALRIR